eukprot:TRINITY_DN13276_c0_g2_i2.p1 TRINITY_DN13276_c0_g2~~TRINITY_DN13276_c0_g2_i2.p1  ORF type:complete len:610 (-),score=135.51 TRINITY_DN13276_c0_g2_i2:6-1835(-)
MLPVVVIACVVLSGWVIWTHNEEHLFVSTHPDQAHEHGAALPWHSDQFLGALVISTMLLLFYGVITPAFDHDNSFHLALIVAWSALCFASLALVLVLSFMNPSDGVPFKHVDVSLLDAKTRSRLFAHVCPTCPPEAMFYSGVNRYHCRRCNKCITDFDHHCTFLNACIGKGNYGVFLAMLVIFNILMMLTVAVSVYAITEARKADGSVNLDTWGRSLFITLVVIFGVFGVVSLMLLACLLQANVAMQWRAYRSGQFVSTFSELPDRLYADVKAVKTLQELVQSNVFPTLKWNQQRVFTVLVQNFLRQQEHRVQRNSGSTRERSSTFGQPADEPTQQELFHEQWAGVPNVDLEDTALWTAFRMFDFNGNKKIDKAEFEVTTRRAVFEMDSVQLTLKALDIDMSVEEVDALLAEHSGEDGSIDWVSFQVLMRDNKTQLRTSELIKRDDLVRVFKLIDRRHVGKISLSDLKQLRAELERDVADDVLTDLLGWADKDGDGDLGEEEFINAVLGRDRVEQQHPHALSSTDWRRGGTTWLEESLDSNLAEKAAEDFGDFGRPSYEVSELESSLRSGEVCDLENRTSTDGLLQGDTVEIEMTEVGEVEVVNAVATV